jgi:hypothetical protein
MPLGARCEVVVGVSREHVQRRGAGSANPAPELDQAIEVAHVGP